MKTLSRILLLTLVPGIALAQVTPADPPVDPPVDEGPVEDGASRHYAVEVIIFRYDELESVGTEVFVPALLGDPEEIPTFGDPAGAAPAEAAAEPSAELRYRLLADDELTMQETLGRLRRLEAYEPLMHFGWIQEAIPEAETPPLALDRFGVPPDGLDGTLTLRLSRYLHLGVDISLAAGDPYVPAAGFAPDDDPASPAATTDYPDDRTRYAPLRYELRETRILRSGETRYYDHPRFGVIARVTRADVDGSGTGDRLDPGPGF